MSPTPKRFWTKPEDCVLLSPVINGFATAPFWDAANGVYARVRYHEASLVLAKFGMAFISEAEWYALFKDPASLVLNPCTLVSTVEDSRKMTSLAFAQKHDACVKKQLDAAGWKGDRILVNCGKQWLDRKNGSPPAAGKSINFGWFQKNGVPIQKPGQAHESTYSDYSQLLQGKAL